MVKKLRSREYEDVLDAINKFTPLLQDDSFEYSLATKVYWIINNINDFPIYVCPVDGVVQTAKYYNIRNQKIGYSTWLNRTGCCHNCSVKNPNVIQKAKERKESFSKERKIEIQKKIEETKLKNHGSKTFNNRKKPHKQQ